ncbi:uncharacterized protein [Haliotis cracherodii]|uniref:uncharacterized protein n=1 Tax=Haliotis cracherodii TaxID=6455 RepID=UPI0039E7D083
MTTLKHVTTIVLVLGLFCVRVSRSIDSAARHAHERNNSSPETLRVPLQRHHTYTNRKSQDWSRYPDGRRTGGGGKNQTSQIAYTSIVPLIAVLGILTVLILAIKQRSLLVKVHNIVHRVEQGSRIYSSLTTARQLSCPHSYTAVRFTAVDPDITDSRPHSYVDMSQPLPRM